LGSPSPAGFAVRMDTRRPLIEQNEFSKATWPGPVLPSSITIREQEPALPSRSPPGSHRGAPSPSPVELLLTLNWENQQSPNNTPRPRRVTHGDRTGRIRAAVAARLCCPGRQRAGSEGLQPAVEKGQRRWDKSDQKVSAGGGLSTEHSHITAAVGC